MEAAVTVTKVTAAAADATSSTSEIAIAGVNRRGLDRRSAESSCRSSCASTILPSGDSPTCR